MVILALFASACVVQLAWSTEHYLSTYSMWTYLLILQHCRPLKHAFHSPPIPCGSLFSWSHTAQRGARSVQCQRGSVGYTALRLSTSLPTRTIWPAPVHRANCAYILANRFFLDLQVEDILQVVGSFCQAAPHKVRPSKYILQVKQEVWLKMVVLPNKISHVKINVALLYIIITNNAPFGWVLLMQEFRFMELDYE